jgi:hypothetical protein
MDGIPDQRLPMGWATPYIAQLKQGTVVSFRPRGHSMSGKIESGQLCTVEPITDIPDLNVGDIVLCKVNGTEYLHLIKAIQGQRFQIGNNRGRINGWIGPASLYGRCVKVEP